MQVLY